MFSLTFFHVLPLEELRFKLLRSLSEVKKGEKKKSGGGEKEEKMR